MADVISRLLGAVELSIDTRRRRSPHVRERSAILEQSLFRVELLTSANGEKRNPFGTARLRNPLVEMLPRDPLRTESHASPSEPLDVFIPMHPKDYGIGRLAISSILMEQDGQYGRVHVCLPNDAPRPQWLMDSRLTLYTETDLRNGVLECQWATIPGWYRQQILKFLFVRSSTQDVLVLDADTVMLRPRQWISGRRQLVLVRGDKPPRYFARHTSRFLADPRPLRHFSMVAHHQLMKPEIVSEIFGPDLGGFEGRLLDWLHHRPDELPADYQIYGSFLRIRYPSQAVVASRGQINAKMTRDLSQDLSDLTQLDIQRTIRVLQHSFPRAFTLSLHTLSVPGHGAQSPV